MPYLVPTSLPLYQLPGSLGSSDKPPSISSVIGHTRCQLSPPTWGTGAGCGGVPTWGRYALLSLTSTSHRCLRLSSAPYAGIRSKLAQVRSPKSETNGQRPITLGAASWQQSLYSSA